ncbi:MAG: DNA-binding protein [Eubacterium sp.]|nr:DNA-binding protein [Eubacterium sp.]
MKEKNFLTASDVAEYMGISVPMAYKVIRQLNDELKAQGYITISGKVSRIYFEKKIYMGVA